MKIPSNVLDFAKSEEDQKVYLMFRDYFNHYRTTSGVEGLEYQKSNKEGMEITFSEKEDQMNGMLKREILRHAGVANMDSFPISTWSNNPLVKWATFAVIGQLIDMVLPEVIIGSVGLYTEVRSIGYGDSAAFDVEPRDLFVVSKAGRAQRTAEVKKQFNGQVTVIPENRQLTVQVSLYKVLAGKESLANFVMKAIASIEAEMTRDVFNTFNTTMEALDNAGDDALRFAGYTQAGLVSLCQKVSAFNGGKKAIVVGTQAALANVLPTDNNYRYTLESDFVKIGYIRTAFGYDVMALPQVADYRTDFLLALDDDNLYVISPAADKPVKLVLEGTTMSNISGVYDNANLTQDATIVKAWGTGIATNAIAGIITL